MKNKLLFLFTVSTIFIILFCNPLISGFGPNTHLNITLTCLEDSDEGLIKNLINENLDACYAGLEYPDVGIFEYYTNFKAYAGLHNYNAVDEMLRVAQNDRERTFAYCYKIHLAEDGVSHNYFVPAAIKRTKLPNYIIHPVEELKIEGRYLDPRANRMMENHAEFDSLVEQATGRDWSAEADKLNIIIGGGAFYTTAYVPESVTLIGKSQNFLYKAVNLFVSPEVGVDYRNLAILECKGVLRGETSALDPSGEKALSQSDAQTQFWLYGVTFVVMIIILALSLKYGLIGFKRRRR